ncbi:hypothetical protein A2U01_0099108, partial [Trifolium medium]|nr:hypothetical protein [Trifolium medium]
NCDRDRRCSDNAPVEAKGGCVPAGTPTLNSSFLSKRVMT